LTLLKQGIITDKSGIEVLRVMLDLRLNNQSCEAPSAIVDRLDLKKVSVAVTADAKSGAECDPIMSSLRTSITEVLSEHPAAVDDFRKGKKGAFNFLIGQLMKKTRGCADPGELSRLLTEELKKEV
jgi:aspartyl-tRNA(Asn)/glutamyl-tRNA(Gln) amidotransferase subunit B